MTQKASNQLAHTGRVKIASPPPAINGGNFWGLGAYEASEREVVQFITENSPYKKQHVKAQSSIFADCLALT